MAELAEIQIAVLREGIGKAVEALCVLAEEQERQDDFLVADQVWDITHDLDTCEIKAVELEGSWRS